MLKIIDPTAIHIATHPLQHFSGNLIMMIDKVSDPWNKLEEYAVKDSVHLQFPILGSRTKDAYFLVENTVWFGGIAC